MRLLVLFCCLWLLPGVASAEPSVGEIRVVSETWTRYPGGRSRVAWDLLRAVYEAGRGTPADRQRAYTRAVGLVLRGEADAWVAPTAGKSTKRFTLAGPMTSIRSPCFPEGQSAAAAGGPEPVPPVMDAWLRLRPLFPYPDPHSELQRRTSALPMLLNHRVDYFIDSRPELEEMLAGAERWRLSTASPTSLGCRCILASPIPQGP